MHLTWHNDIRFRPPPPASVASASNDSTAPHESNGSEVLAWGATLDSVDALDSDQGLNRRDPMNLKSWPGARL